MTEGLFQMKVLKTKDGKTPNKCSVIIVFGGVDEKDYIMFNQFVKKAHKDLPHLGEYLQKQAVQYRYTHRMVILKSTALPGDINKAVKDVGPEGIVFVNLGSVPQYIFNLLFFGAYPPSRI